jgi:hypothetical protein
MATKQAKTTQEPECIYTTDGWSAGPEYAEWHRMPDGRYRYTRRSHALAGREMDVTYQTTRPTSRWEVPETK